MNLHQGVRLQLPGDSRCYQLLSIDAPRGRCYLRQLPLTRDGSPVLDVALDALTGAEPV